MHLCLMMGAVSFRRWCSIKKPPYSPRKVYKSHKKSWKRRCFIEGRKWYLWRYCFCRCYWHLQKCSSQTAELLPMVRWKYFLLGMLLFVVQDHPACYIFWQAPWNTYLIWFTSLSYISLSQFWGHVVSKITGSIFLECWPLVPQISISWQDRLLL